MNFDERNSMSEAEVHHVLCDARNVQERRGYDWHGGTPVDDGGCCPGCAVAVAVGESSYVNVMDHPAALVLADQFVAVPPGSYDDDLSGRARWTEIYGDGLDLPGLLARYDRAIAATAPEPAFESLSTEPATAREPITQESVVV